MTETPSKREQVREERRQQIIQAALDVFSSKGYHAANVSDVAAEAGVSQGTIYWYFDSKDELFEAAAGSVIEGLGLSALQSLDELGTATEKLMALTELLGSFIGEAESLFTLFLGYWASSSRSDKDSRWWIDLLVEYKDAVTGIVEEGVSSGEFRPVDADSLVWSMLAAYDGLAAYRTLMPDLDVSRICRAYVDTFFKGLLVEASEGRAA